MTKPLKLDREFQEGDLGKIILYKKGKEIYLSSATTTCKSLKERIKEDEDEFGLITAKWKMVDFLSDDVIREMITQCVGYYKDIEHSGKILGKACIAFVDDRLYVSHYTCDGSVYEKKLKKCLDSKGIELVLAEYIQDFEYIPLSEFISKTKDMQEEGK